MLPCPLISVENYFCLLRVAICIYQLSLLEFAVNSHLKYILDLKLK